MKHQEMFLIIVDSRTKIHWFTIGGETQPPYVRNKGYTIYSVKESIREIHVKILTLWIKERTFLLRGDFVLIVADMGREKTSVRAGDV